MLIGKRLLSTWYEFFSRSASSVEGKHRNFKDWEQILPKVAKIWFDTKCFPHVHPIEEANRKGKNNAIDAQSWDVVSPWGIGM